LNSETLLPFKEGVFIGFDGVRCMAVTDSMHIALGCEDGTISILDAKTYAILLRIEGHEQRHPPADLNLIIQYVYRDSAKSFCN
jgi:L-asparaginase II